MTKFINDEFPMLELPRSVALTLVKRVADLFPQTMTCSDKKFGPDNYMCRSLASHSRKARDDFEGMDWGGQIEFAGIALDFVGAALKQSSKYLTLIRPADLDYDMILADIEAREDIVLTE